MLLKKFAVISALLIILLAACSAPDEMPNIPETSTIEEVPEPGDDTGVIYGYIFDLNNEPINESIYITKDIAYDQPDLPPTISFSYQSDPRGTLQENGFFYFADIEPAENYVLVVFVGIGDPIVVREPDSEQLLMIAVDAGESVDLGELLVDIYP